ncbi:MAG: hypothetical protein FWD76_01445 [Firmicutes bacterium]|nr:hypothetical protein [Bacillota bacterium]
MKRKLGRRIFGMVICLAVIGLSVSFVFVPRMQKRAVANTGTPLVGVLDGVWESNTTINGRRMFIIGYSYELDGRQTATSTDAAYRASEIYGMGLCTGYQESDAKGFDSVVGVKVGAEVSLRYKGDIVLLMPYRAQSVGNGFAIAGTAVSSVAFVLLVLFAVNACKRAALYNKVCREGASGTGVYERHSSYMRVNGVNYYRVWYRGKDAEGQEVTENGVAVKQVLQRSLLECDVQALRYEGEFPIKILGSDFFVESAVLQEILKKNRGKRVVEESWEDSLEAKALLQELPGQKHGQEGESDVDWANIMVCTKCKAFIQPDAKFCKECGSPNPLFANRQTVAVGKPNGLADWIAKKSREKVEFLEQRDMRLAERQDKALDKQAKAQEHKQDKDGVSKQEDKEQKERDKIVAQSLDKSGENAACPYCFEKVKPGAKKCKSCGQEII